MTTTTSKKKTSKYLSPVVLVPKTAELYVMLCPSHAGKYEIVVLGGSSFLVSNINTFFGNYHKHLNEIKPNIPFSAGTLYHWKGEVVVQGYNLLESMGEWTSTVLFSSKKIPPPKKVK